MMQRGGTKLFEQRNKPSEVRESERNVSVKKKSSVPKQSAQEYMAYLNMQGSARFGV